MSKIPLETLEVVGELEIQKHFKALFEKLKAQQYLVFNDKATGRWTGKVTSGSGKEYGLAAWTGPEEYNIILHEDEKCKHAEKILKIVFFNNKTGGSKVAGKFVYDAKQLWIGRKNIFNSKRYHHDLGARKYKEVNGVFLIAPLDNPIALLHELCDFHELIEVAKLTRSDHEEKSSRDGTLANQGKFRSGFDPGNSREYSRKPSELVRALHNRVSVALFEKAKSLGYQPKEIRGVTSPDFLATKAGLTYLFEVKPDVSPASLMMALGQLLTYSLEYKIEPSYCVIVVPHGKCTNHSKLVLNILLGMGMKILRFSHKSLEFDKLHEILK
jgi:hypothetical protein